MTLISSRGAHLAPPTADEIREGLRRLFPNDFEAIWDRACTEAAIPAASHSLDPAQTLRIIEVIGGLDPLCRIVSLSWHIRLTAAQKLAEIGK